MGSGAIEKNFLELNGISEEEWEKRLQLNLDLDE
jgi:hypothetical protein